MEKIQSQLGMLRKNHNQPTNKNKRKWQIINKKKAHQTNNGLVCLKKLFRKKCQKVKDSHKWSLNMNIFLIKWLYFLYLPFWRSGLKMLKKTTFPICDKYILFRILNLCVNRRCVYKNIICFL